MECDSQQLTSENSAKELFKSGDGTDHVQSTDKAIKSFAANNTDSKSESGHLTSQMMMTL